MERRLERFQGYLYVWLRSVSFTDSTSFHCPLFNLLFMIFPALRMHIAFNDFLSKSVSTSTNLVERDIVSEVVFILSSLC